MGKREPVHFDSFKSYNNSSENTFSGITAQLREIYSLSVCWDIDVNQHSSTLRYM